MHLIFLELLKLLSLILDWIVGTLDVYLNLDANIHNLIFLWKLPSNRTAFSDCLCRRWGKIPRRYFSMRGHCAQGFSVSCKYGHLKGCYSHPCPTATRKTVSWVWSRLVHTVARTLRGLQCMCVHTCEHEHVSGCGCALSQSCWAPLAVAPLTCPPVWEAPDPWPYVPQVPWEVDMESVQCCDVWALVSVCGQAGAWAHTARWAVCPAGSRKGSSSNNWQL